MRSKVREQRADPTSPLKNADSQGPQQLTWTSSVRLGPGQPLKGRRLELGISGLSA